MNASDNYKESKKALEETEKQNEKKNGLRCWLYNNKHQLMDCHQFKRKPVKERIDFVTKEKICKICFSIIHLLKDCICSIKCRVDGCGKKHHTLLHIESPHQATINFTSKQDMLHTFLQVILVTTGHGANITVDSGSETTLITSDLAKILKQKGKQRQLNITIAISTSVSVTSKLVEF